MPTAYDQLRDALAQAATLGSVAALSSWDQETYMPPAAAAHRAEQLSLLAGMIHERRTDPRLGELIAACEADASLTKDPATAASLREIRRDYDRATKLPKALVEEIAKTTSQAQEVWKKARQASDFALFSPWLAKVFELMRKKAQCYGIAPGGELYDALLDDNEPGATAAQIEGVFGPLRPRLSDLIQRVRESKKKVNTPRKIKPREIKPPAAQQHELGMFVLKAMGFDMDAVRLDTTAHPFCSGIAPGDTRLTTRYSGEAFTDALYGTMHEGGHGLYEQGLPKSDPKLWGTPLSEAVSLGIHESQSRLWENFVGRGRPFWTWLLPKAKKILGKGLGRANVEAMYAAVNTCKPSLIRVEADEGTYNLHVMIRFTLERALLRGDLSPKDLPGAWNERYAKDLGVKVPDDRRGCLQDVHWSFGLVGYFPTYTLGNLYAAQFWEAANAKMPDLNRQMARGKFNDLRNWLGENIHRHGRRYRAGELCERVTGKPLSHEPLLRHLHERLAPVYGL